MKRKTKQVAYTYEEFAQDLRAQEFVRKYEFITRHGEDIEIGQDDSFEASVFRNLDYFHQVYPRKTAIKKAMVFMRIVTHLAARFQKYNRGTLAIDGSEYSVVSEQLTRALHDYFTSEPPPSGVTDDDIVTAVTELAETKYKDYK